MTSRRSLRRAGSRWRVLVHDMVATRGYGRAHHIASSHIDVDARYGDLHRLPNTELDEVVVGSWFHLEQMDAGRWWMDVSGITINVAVDNRGRARSVMVEPEPVDGVVYHVPWPTGDGHRAANPDCPACPPIPGYDPPAGA